MNIAYFIAVIAMVGRYGVFGVPGSSDSRMEVDAVYAVSPTEQELGRASLIGQYGVQGGLGNSAGRTEADAVYPRVSVVGRDGVHGVPVNDVGRREVDAVHSPAAATVQEQTQTPVIGQYGAQIIPGNSERRSKVDVVYSVRATEQDMASVYNAQDQVKTTDAVVQNHLGAANTIEKNQGRLEDTVVQEVGRSASVQGHEGVAGIDEMPGQHRQNKATRVTTKSSNTTAPPSASRRVPLSSRNSTKPSKNQRKGVTSTTTVKPTTTTTSTTKKDEGTTKMLRKTTASVTKAASPTRTTSPTRTATTPTRSPSTTVRTTTMMPTTDDGTGKNYHTTSRRPRPEQKVEKPNKPSLKLPVGATSGLSKPTKYHYYPHNQHIYLLPECAIQQVCNAVYVRLNYTQPLCACPTRYQEPCSASLRSDDLHTTELVTDPRGKALTLVKTCEPVEEMRRCKAPRDWSLLALQNVRTGKSHYLVLCRCPDENVLEGPMNHDQPTYASVPGIRVYGMMCVQEDYDDEESVNYRRSRPLRLQRDVSKTRPSFPWSTVQELARTIDWDD